MAFFESYQCDYKGFACKSQVDQSVEVHDRLVREYNDLVRDREALRNAGNKLSVTYDDLEGEFPTPQRIVRDLVAALASAETCLLYADTMEGAKTCPN